MHGILTMTHLTIHEARRRKILLATLVFGLAFLTLFATGFYFINRKLQGEQAMSAVQRKLVLNSFVMAGFYAVNFLMIMTAVLVPVDTLSGEISSGVIQTIATKPVRRSEIVLGPEPLRDLELDPQRRERRAQLVCCVTDERSLPLRSRIDAVEHLVEGDRQSMYLVLCSGTRLSTIANGVTVFGLYGLAFIGGWMEQIGTLVGNSTTRYLGIVASLLVPSESLWQLAAYHMQPPLMRDLHLTPFSPASVPSANMVLWAAGYTAAALGVALWQFRTRNL